MANVVSPALLARASVREGQGSGGAVDVYCRILRMAVFVYFIPQKTTDALIAAMD